MISDTPKTRYFLLDSLRGLTLVSMMAYHTVWDLVYIFGLDLAWYESPAAFYWQQSICWSFILLSGFCWQLGSRSPRRGVTVLLGSCVISAVTLIFMPENRILFGVLSLIGSAMLLMIPLHPLLQRMRPLTGAGGSFLLFLLTRHINSGTLSVLGHRICSLPSHWYANLFTAYLGFPSALFISQDYFPLLPWLFLYLTGYFLFSFCRSRGLQNYFTAPRIPPLEWLGRHSLPLYMLHQPVIYGLLWLLL